MADPLSVTAAIVGITVPALQGTRLLLNDLEDLKDAPKTIERLKDDINDVTAVLELIQDVSERDWERLGSKMAERSKDTMNTMTSCKRACDIFRTDLQRWTRHSGDGKLAWQDRTNIGLFKQRQIKAMSEQLQSCKQTISSFLSAANLHGSIHQNQITEEIKTSIVANRTSGRPETPPEPVSNVPFRRDPDFVEREDVLNQIEEKCAVEGSWTMLVGLGGVGKSQLAIEYSYRVRDRSPQTWVFWVHASNEGRFEQGYRDVADCLQIPGRQDPKANIFKLVHDWLRDSKAPWLFIVDNLDDAGFILNTQSLVQPGSKLDSLSNTTKPLKEYLPRSGHGSVLMTTRNKAVALRLGLQRDYMDVQPMALKDALSLFQKKLGTCDDTDDVDEISELVAAIEFMPLAIVQAASYISQRGPRFSVSQYLQKLQQNDFTVAYLLDAGSEDVRRDWEANNSILLTWHMSFKYLYETRRSAADLLSLMSFFDRQGIPEVLLKHRVDVRVGHEESDDSNHSLANDSIESFEEDLIMLQNFSFISITEDPSVFEMHRLVQLATRIWLESQRELEKWQHQSIHNLSKEIPTGEYENWSRCQALLPHARSAALQRPKDDGALEAWATIMYGAAWYLRESGNYNEAEKIATEAMKVRMDLLGEEDVDTIDSKSMVALILLNQGRWNEAQQMYVRIVEMKEKVLGGEHASTLYSTAHLAKTFMEQGRWKESETLEIQVMEIRTRVLGENHQEVANSMLSLATLYDRQGRFKEAETQGVRAAKMYSKILGEENPDTLIALEDLASVYHDLGRLKQAEELNIQVMKTRKRALGETHPDTLRSMDKLVHRYSSQGRFQQAEELGMRVLETRKKVFGEEHIDTLMSWDTIALNYYRQGQYKEAEKLHMQVIETQKRVLGEEHPTTLICIDHLITTLRDQDRFKEAEELVMQLLETRNKMFGVEHPDTLKTMSGLEAIHIGQGRFKEAEGPYIQIIEMQKRIIGEHSPETLISMANLALIYSHQGRHEEAAQLGGDCFRLMREGLGADNPSTLFSMHNLAAYWAVDGRSKEATKLESECFELRTKVLGASHVNTLDSMHNLAYFWSNQGHYEKAVELTSECVKLRTKMLGVDHHATLASMHNLACFWKYQGDNEKATQLMKECVELRAKVLGADHDATRRSKESLELWTT